MKERFDKTKSNDNFISNSNATYQDQLNKQKFFRGYNNNQYNNLSGINKIPNNKMNILPSKPKQIEQLYSDFNYKIICVIIIMILFFGVISFLIVYFILTKINKINNYITYDCYTSEDNPYINQKFLNEHEGKIDIKINEIQKSLRQINEGEDGKKMINVKIKIDYKLSNFSQMFEGCKDIINIDLSKIEGSIIKDMSNLFKDCSNLEIVNFGNLDTSRVTSMKYLFKGCTSLSEIIGLENLNTSHLNTINRMFVGCEDLYYVNLSSFNLSNIKEKKLIFDENYSLKYVDLRNSKNIKISKIFKEEFFKDRNVYIFVDDNSNLEYNKSSSWLHISQNFNIKCNKGEEEKCKSCEDNNLTCYNCNDGYYLTNSRIYSKYKCRKCKDECNKCHDDEYGEVFCDIDELIDSSTTDENIEDSEEPSDSDSIE